MSESIFLDYMCLTPYKLHGMNLSRIVINHEGCGGIRDFRVFQTSGRNFFSKFSVNAHRIRNLVSFIKLLYPYFDRSLRLDEYWDEIDIYKKIREMNVEELILWLEDKTYDLEQFRSFLFQDDSQKDIFRSFMQEKVCLYCLVDDDNENCAYAPYIIFGKNSLLVFVYEWIL